MDTINTKQCVVLGISGGIAAYKAVEIASLLTKRDVEVYCVMTAGATEFITPLTLRTITNRPVAVNMFAEVANFNVDHIALAKRADVFLIAPATANIIGKMASGISDDMLSATVMATTAPIVLAPAMNTNMWNNKAVQRNMEYLRSIGVTTVGPDSGRLACGDSGEGRMSDPRVVADYVLSKLHEIKETRTADEKRDYLEKNVLITAGPTREPLDPVRYISNRSSGKMGYEIAARSRDRGASVTLLTGPVAISPPEGVKVVPVTTALELYDEVIDRLPGQDVIIQAAAVADYRPEQASSEKIKKFDDGKITMTFVQNPDIAAEVGRRKQPGQYVVAFAAETHDAHAFAKEKRIRKNADMIVVNDVMLEGAGFEVDTNIVTLITDADEITLPMMSKRDVADILLDHIAKNMI